MAPQDFPPSGMIKSRIPRSPQDNATLPVLVGESAFLKQLCSVCCNVGRSAEEENDIPIAAITDYAFALALKWPCIK